MSGARRSRGFVLVNALVLVAALSGVALALLSRAEGSRARVLVAGQAVQLELYLDAYEALAQNLLNRDPGPVDHLREAWARDDNALELDRGEISGQLRDLQGGFNLNWLAGRTGEEEEDPNREIFDRLLTRLGVAPRVGDLIVETLGREGLGRSTRPGSAVPEDLPGGSALMLDQLPIPERALTRLAPHISVIPGGSKLNVNTTTVPVLAAFLDGANPAALDTLLRSRKNEPFVSVEDFKNRLVEAIGAEASTALSEDRISIGSDWFEVQIAARLEGRIATRRVVLRRFPLPAGAKVAYRQDRW